MSFDSSPAARECPKLSRYSKQIAVASSSRIVTPCIRGPVRFTSWIK